MNVLYLGYWSASDTLTQSVIVPRLELLSQKVEVDKVIFCSIERFETGSFQCPPKTEWIRFKSNDKGNVFFTKFSDFSKLPSFLRVIFLEKRIDLVIANSPLAGGACYLALKGLEIPFIIECFEPHAESMRESGVWKVWDPRYWILRHLEKMQKKYAWKLITVSTHYSNKLKEEKVDIKKIITLPNCLKINDFKFNSVRRKSFRQKLNLVETNSVGIYVGKFGGIYYDHEAFELFHRAFIFFGEQFRLIIISGQDQEEITKKLTQHKIDFEKVFVASVSHDQVANYLSAADFAFATIKPTPTRVYCCPVKNGEYWASGLPVLLEEGIGDDSDIIKQYGGGVIFKQADPISGFLKLRELLSKKRQPLAEIIFSIAYRFRRFELIEEVYKQIIEDFNEQGLLRIDGTYKPDQ